LRVPEKTKGDTAAYRDEQDIIGEWIAENCDTGPGCSMQKSSLYLDYGSWTGRNGHRPCSQTKLTRRLNERGHKLAADKRTVTGLSLKSPAGMARNV
jgi:putative DNA primase/helicase